MEADFLMMVVLTVNQEIYSDAECRRLGLELLQEQVRHRGKDWTEAKRRGWLQTFLGIAVEVLTLKGVVQQVEHEFFSGNVVLLRDAAEALDEGFGLINQVGIRSGENQQHAL